MTQEKLESNYSQEAGKDSRKRSTIIFSALTIVSRATGLLRVMLLAAALSLSRLNDAFNVANVLPHMIYEFVLGGILTAAFIPIFVPYLENEEKRKEGWRVANILFGTISLWLGVISLIASIFSPYLIYLQTLFAEQPKDRLMAIYFFRWFAFQIILYGISSFFSGLLNAYHRFAITAVAPIFNNIIAIFTFFLYLKFPSFGVTGLAIGTTLGVAVMALIQLPPLIKLGWRPHPIFLLKDPVVKQFFKLGIPVVGYVAINQIGFLVRTNLAYPIEGGFSALQIGFNFFNLPYGIFAVAITTVIFPALSKAGSEKDWINYRSITSQGFRWIAIALFPASALLFILSEPSVILLMEYGRFTGRDVEFLSKVISAYALGIVPYGFFMFLTRSFYALKDTKTPMVINSIGVGFNIIGNIIIVKYFGVEGIALMVGVTYLIMIIIGLRNLQKHVGAFSYREFGKTILYITILTILCSLAAYYLKHNLVLSGPRKFVAGGTFIIPALVFLIFYSIGIFLHFRVKKEK